MSLNSTIAELLVQQGRDQASGVMGSGQAYGSALSNLGQTIGQTIQTATDPRIQLERQQAAEGAQRIADLKTLDTAFQNPGGRDAIIAALPGHLRGQVSASFDAADESAAKAQKAQLDADTANTDYLYTLASNVKAHDYTPESLQLAISHAKQTFSRNPALVSQLTPIEQQLQANPSPDAVKSLIDPIIQAHNEQEKAVLIPPTPRGGAPATLTKNGVTIATGPAAPAQPPTEAELALQASGGDPTVAMGLLKPKPNATAEQDDQRYRDIQARLDQKLPITSMEQAWSDAYEKQKTLGVDKSAGAAAGRQADAIAQQTAEQKRQQDFAQAQAGRADLTNKVEQPYFDAKEKADTLRTVIEAAKNGNMAAGSVQNLLGTLGLVTTEGVKRINNVELQQVAGAGSLFERLKGAVSKLKTGDPLSPKVQSDLSQLSDLLEQSARKKYEQAFNATTTRYGLKDEQMIPSGETAPANQSTVPANVSAVLKGVGPGKHTLSDGSVWMVGSDGSITKGS